MTTKEARQFLIKFGVNRAMGLENTIFNDVLNEIENL